MYLLHLKFCDFAAYAEVMDRRNATTAEVGGDVKDTAIGRHWFASARGEDRAVFEAFAELEMVEGFDMSPYRRKMRRTFRARGDTGYYCFDRPDYRQQFILPERFNGVV
ncbi:MAG: hypothetical protein LPJ93_02400 [Rhodobacterales bacterium]|nr:hypothetical protein [Rhodobacterales bacterium]